MDFFFLISFHSCSRPGLFSFRSNARTRGAAYVRGGFASLSPRGGTSGGFDDHSNIAAAIFGESGLDEREPGFRNGITGSISVDVGATAIALVNYLSAAGMLLLTAAVAINRNRAESILISTTAAVVFIAFACLLQDLFCMIYLVSTFWRIASQRSKLLASE